MLYIFGIIYSLQWFCLSISCYSLLIIQKFLRWYYITLWFNCSLFCYLMILSLEPLYLVSNPWNSINQWFYHSILYSLNIRCSILLYLIIHSLESQAPIIISLDRAIVSPSRLCYSIIQSLLFDDSITSASIPCYSNSLTLYHSRILSCNTL